MTPTSPTWGDIESFLAADGWRQVSASERGGRRQRHLFFEKLLDDGRLLQTHISHDRDAGPGPGVFGKILKYQLEVSKQEFWQAIDAGQPVARPVVTDEADVVELPSWVVRVLTGQMHMTAETIAQLSAEDAERLVREFWARPG